ERERGERQLRGAGEDLEDAVEHRALASEPAAEIPPGGVGGVPPVLDPDRPVQSELVADLSRARLRQGLVARKDQHRIAGDQVKHQKGDHGDADENRDELPDALDDVPEHGPPPDATPPGAPPSWTPGRAATSRPGHRTTTRRTPARRSCRPAPRLA